MDKMLDEFKNRVQNSIGIVCYGAGKRFRRFMSCFEGTSILGKLLYCVDKNSSLQESGAYYRNQLVQVYSVKKLQEIRNNNIILLITNERYDRIIEELREQYSGIEYFCFSHILGEIEDRNALQKKVPQSYKITNIPVIPKVIHYFWFGKNPIPDKYKAWMNSWRKKCPDYEIKEWNENNYDVTKNSYMYEAYQKKKWAFVPDYARLDIIYQYGGIYLDTDVELVNGLDDMLYQKGFAGFESDETVALGLGFGAIKGLPIIGKMRDEYNGKHFINQDGTLNLVASPVIQTEYLKQRGLLLNGQYQTVDDLTIYPEIVFSGKSIYSRKLNLQSCTKSIHHYEGTWLDNDTRRFNEKYESGTLEFDVHGFL